VSNNELGTVLLISVLNFGGSLYKGLGCNLCHDASLLAWIGVRLNLEEGTHPEAKTIWCCISLVVPASKCICRCKLDIATSFVLYHSSSRAVEQLNADNGLSLLAASQFNRDISFKRVNAKLQSYALPIELIDIGGPEFTLDGNGLQRIKEVNGVPRELWHMQPNV
jgi:hypothetical protein